MEYISFHGYIRNTASDTEVHAEPSLELTGVPDQWKRIYKKPMQNLVGKPLVEYLFLTRDQALNLWSGSTESKTLDYQRTNPREFQMVRTHTKETTGI